MTFVTIERRAAIGSLCLVAACKSNSISATTNNSSEVAISGTQTGAVEGAVSTLSYS